MTTATEQKLMTADELLLMPKIDGRRFELIRGVLVEKMPSGKAQGLVSSRVNIILGNYAEDNDFGVTLSNDTGHRLDRDPDTVRAPDVAWFAPGRLPEDVVGFPELAPDLAVEVKSPSNSWPEISAKAQMWLCYGSQEVWVADPPTVTIVVYRPNVAPLTLREDDTLDGGNLLPGFSTSVWRLFRRRR